MASLTSFCGIRSRHYSRHLQRVITDFGADVPFAQVGDKLKEHDGMSVPTSSARLIDYKHAEKSILNNRKMKA
jgi:hypothetical protein